MGLLAIAGRVWLQRSYSIEPLGYMYFRSLQDIGGGEAGWLRHSCHTQWMPARPCLARGSAAPSPEHPGDCGHDRPEGAGHEDAVDEPARRSHVIDMGTQPAGVFGTVDTPGRLSGHTRPSSPHPPWPRPARPRSRNLSSASPSRPDEAASPCLAERQSKSRGEITQGRDSLAALA